MPGRSAPPLTLALKPSRRLLGAVGGCYALAAAASLANALPWGWRGLMLLLVLAGAWLNWQKLTGRVSMKAVATLLPGWKPLVVTRLRVDAADAWRLWTMTDDEIPVTLLPGSINTSWLILLHFRDEDGRFYAVPVLPDSLEAGDFRRLTVRLRIIGLP